MGVARRAGGARRIPNVAERNGSGNGDGSVKGSFKVKAGLAQMLKGGVIMDVVTAEHARIAQEAGACAVMALERVPADIRKEGGVARMYDPELIRSIMAAVTIPVMAKCRIGHFVEAQILEALGVDYIDESEVLTPADEENHIDKHPFKVPFVCGCRDLGEATRRIAEGAAMIRTKGEAGTGNVVEAVRHARAVNAGIRKLQGMNHAELVHEAKQIGAPVEVLVECQKLGRLPVVNFAAGGIATPADAALMMQLGVDGVFVGSGIFKSEDPLKRAKAIVAATTYFEKPDVLAEVSAGLGSPLRDAIRGGLATLATCAGMIVLAKDITDGMAEQHGLGLLDIGVRRNGYGRQVDSFEAPLHIEGLNGKSFPGVFIRAPLVERTGDVDVIAAHDGRPVAVRHDRILALGFHPELSGDLRLHREFVRLAGSRV